MGEMGKCERISYEKYGKKDYRQLTFFTMLGNTIAAILDYSHSQETIPMINVLPSLHGCVCVRKKERKKSIFCPEILRFMET